MATKKVKPVPGPDDLVRVSAGAYMSGDGRFEVQKSDQGWFVVDNEQANEFGQQLIHGPLATLDDVRAAIPGARDIRPLLRSMKRPSAPPKPAAAKNPAPPKSWIDRLSKAEAADVRRLIRALEDEGVAGAEALVKHDRDSSLAVAAAALIEQHLRALVDAAPDKERAAIRAAVRRAVEILADEGGVTARPLPRWELVETLRDPAQPSRKLRIRL